MDVGNKGETFFENWCYDVDLVPNKSKIDKHGWDYIVGLPKTYRANLKSLDKDDSHDQIFVQVKTTEKEKGNRSIKLSNLKRLVTSPLPSFYVLIQVSKKGEVVKAHLFHVWDRIIEMVQKSLRQTRREEWDRLHKVKLTLPWSEAQEFKKFNGWELQNLLKENIKLGKSEYAIKKNKLREKVGYEKDRGKIEFEGVLPDRYKDDPDSFLVDLLLGEIEKVDLIKFEEIDKRFGQEIITNKGDGGHFKISNIKPEGEAELTFNTIDHRSIVEFNTEYFVPHGIGELVDRKKIKILYKAPYIKFFLFPYSKEITYKFSFPDFRKEIALSELLDIARIMLFLNEIEDDESIEFLIKIDGKKLFEGSLNFSKYTEKEPLKYFKAVKATYTVLNYFNIEHTIRVKPKELYAQLNWLDFFQKLLSPVPLHMNIGLSLKTDLDSYKKTIALLPFTLTIGKYLIPIQVSVEGEPEKTGEVKGDEIMYIMNSNNVRIEQHRKLSRDKGSSKEAHKKMNEISIAKYDIRDDVMVVHFGKEN